MVYAALTPTSVERKEEMVKQRGWFVNAIQYSTDCSTNHSMGHCTTEKKSVAVSSAGSDLQVPPPNPLSIAITLYEALH